MSSFIPFDDDVQRLGHYVYTGEDSPLSSKLANKAQTRLIHEAVLNLPESSSLLDIGCGDGTYTNDFLALKIGKIVGIDLSEGGIQSAKKNYESTTEILEFYCESLEDHTARGFRYDIAVLRGVIHHAEDPADLIAGVAHIAKYLIISDPNGLNPVLKVIEKVSPYHIEHQEKSFTPKTIRQWLNAGDFELKSTKVGVLVPFFAPSLLAKVLNSLQKAVEQIPLARWVLCGTQVHTASSRKSE